MKSSAAEVFRQVGIALVVLTSLGASTGLAQDRTRIYIVPQGGDDDLSRAIADAQNHFVSRVTAEGRFSVAADVEFERVVSECLDAVDPSPTERRECQLQMARRTFVAWVLVIQGRELASGAIEVTLEVIDPAQGESPFVVPVESRSATTEAAARDALARLAQQFVAWAHPTEAERTGFLEVMALTGGAETGTLCVNGREVGPVPGQYPVPSGLLRVEVSALGFQPVANEVVISPGELVDLPPVALDPVPAVVHLRSNVHHATVTVDGERAGETWAGGTVRLVLTPGSHRVQVSRPGYRTFAEGVSLEAGEFRQLMVSLEAEQ